ncbi:MAG: RNA polymerase sigma factor [Gemmatimonadaceae bacterium]|nr:RNA polymerase sigma factor [Gemmatimonadaceae bacterium]
MVEDTASHARDTIDALYRSDSRRVLATLIRLLGDFDLAEEGLHDAFAAALEKWPADGVPANPLAWLISTGRFKAVDPVRRRARLDAKLASLAERFDYVAEAAQDLSQDEVEDDRLRLIFTCCHPALSPDARIALTLREVCGLTTEQVAHAFLTPAPTLAQRIVRAKTKIRDARIPYEIPSRSDLPARLDSVLHVVYLVFNEGYLASSGSSLTRPDLAAEAIRLGQLIVELLGEPEAVGLLALMLLHDARSAARTSESGELVLLEDQDRSLWNRARIDEGVALVESALASRRFGPYTLQAAIAAVHAEASDAADTDWTQIVALYDVLLRIDESPVVALNRAAAIAMRDGPNRGLELIDAILADGSLADYHPAHAARADLCRRLGRTSEAIVAYERALSLTTQEPERRYLSYRLRQLRDRLSGEA